MRTPRAFTPALLLFFACGPLPATSSSDSETSAEVTVTSSSTGAATTGAATTGVATTGVTTTGAITGATMTTGGVDTTGTASTSADVTSGTFIPVPDVPSDNDCDPFDPNACPAGQKCTFEGVFSDTHCVDIADVPKGLYEPCEILMGDAFSGFDDCGPEMFCWNVDENTGVGECVGMCVGSLETLECADPAASCSICQDCVTGLCLPGCDPLLQECSDGNVCIPDPQNSGGFTCVIDASGEEGQVFDPCEYANVCDEGNVCVEPKFAVECDPKVIGCCLPFCDTTNPVCPGAGQECLPWFEMGMAPAGLEDVGLCGVPQP